MSKKQVPTLPFPPSILRTCSMGAGSSNGFANELRNVRASDPDTDHHRRVVRSRILRHSNSIDPERRTDKQTACYIGMVLVAACGGARRGMGRGDGGDRACRPWNRVLKWPCARSVLRFFFFSRTA